MDLELKERFDAVCKKYPIPEGVELDRLLKELFYVYEGGLFVVSREKDPNARAVELIKFIQGLRKKKNLLVGQEIIRNEETLDALEAFLQVQLFQYFGLEKESTQAGYYSLVSFNSKEDVKIKAKKVMGAALDHPFTDEELNALLRMIFAINEGVAALAGKGWTAIPLLGQYASRLLEACPEIEGMNKTDRYNFVGELLDAAGLLSGSAKWQAQNEELAGALCTKKDISSIRNDRLKQVQGWLDAAQTAQKHLCLCEYD